MSIVAMRKLTLCGPASEKRRLVRGLQELGCLHLIPLSAPDADTAGENQPTLDQANRALRYLLDAPYVRRSARPDDRAAFETVVQQVLETKQRERDLIDRRDHLTDRLAALAPWGDFELPDDPADLGGVGLWFYALDHRQADALAELTDPWVEVARGNRRIYLVVLRRSRPPAGLLPEPPVDTEGKGTRQLRRELEDTRAAIEEVELERIALTRHIPLLRRRMARALDAGALQRALASTRDADGLFALQGWVPAPRADQVRRFAERHHAAFYLEAPAADEMPPTLLDNPPALRAGEDLAHFYQVPPARDWDPSGVLLISFALFFGMILSDAGYGALVLLLALWPLGLWRGETGRRMRRMVGLLGVASVAVGALAGSYFGLAPEPGGPAARLAVLDLRDYGVAMKLSVLIGVLHISLGNAAWAAAHWPSPPALARLGWIAAAVAGFAGWLLHDAGQRAAVPAALAVGALGLLAVLLFASDRRVRGPADLGLRVLDGLLNLTNVTKVFGDVLSYLRLFALGLATVMLATTFNELAAQAGASLTGLGIFTAILIAVVGHTLTFVLAVVSGVVHGLRLDYIEFYGWGLSGEGYAFQPLHKRERAT